MKIVVLNHTDVRVELLNVVDSLWPDEIEEFLYDRGFDVSNISWMEVPSDVHDYGPSSSTNLMSKIMVKKHIQNAPQG